MERIFQFRVSSSAPKLKGKISSSLAAKTALAIRCDALGDCEDNSMGLENRAKLEARLRNLEGRELGHSAGSAKGKPKIEAYDKDRKKGAGAMITAAKTYNPASDSILGQTAQARENEEVMIQKKAPARLKKEKKEKKKKKVAEEDEEAVELKSEEVEKKEKKKKKKHSAEIELEAVNANVEEEKNKTKRKRQTLQVEEETEVPSKKKEKKKKKTEV